MLLDELLAQGFDESYVSEPASKRRPIAVHIGCSQCEALVICGIATHETGCPNRMFECAECGGPTPNRSKLCEDCWQNLYAPIPDEYDEDDR